ncbi:hypothetical protein [Marinospirillum perlucidum]|uniref:hypothetical protein n=1 Tax=Marinospirillum perlucidum TaxID=1982602 RepID=UPI000DF2C22F|nr:hypothetical protein [Marinospirillum perlucidum]
MVDMAKMKEQALQRKREHEEKELRKQMGGSKSSARRGSSRGSSRSGSSRGRSQTRGRANPSAQRALAAQQQRKPKKRKRSISRWVLDILLVLGALLVIVVFLNPF